VPAGIPSSLVERAFYEPLHDRPRRQPMTRARDLDAAHRLGAWLIAVTPAGTAAAAGLVEPGAAFDDTESAAVARAVPRRRDEFFTGRRLARRALAELGASAVAIPAAADRVPVWPDGYLGTISHCDTLCVAQVARRGALDGLGVDVERVGAFEPAMMRLVAADDEWRRIAADLPADIDPGTLCFSAKEAAYKAVFPILRTFLDFGDVRLEVDAARGAFAVSPSSPDVPWIARGDRLAGRFERFGDHLVTTVWIRP